MDSIRSLILRRRYESRDEKSCAIGAFGSRANRSRNERAISQGTPMSGGQRPDGWDSGTR